MKQVVQPVSGGAVRVLDVPRPTIDATQVLVRTVASVVSPGTEAAVTALARSTLLAKARARPDLVRQVVRKARTDGLAATARAVRARLESDLPLGYSAAGIALEVGEAVVGIAPGQLVASGGAGGANHAEFQAVSGMLCVPVPSSVPADDAAFATVGAIALHGFRLAEVGPGSKVVVIGLGLIGQLAARLAQASGCDVAGIDVADLPLERARGAGVLALREEGAETTDAVLEWSRGQGADAVLVTAADRSSAVMARVPHLCRDRANVVVIGDVGLELDRTSLYEKELSVRVARSYGPGRYDRTYEDWGVDYPAGYVRWTERRNMEAVLDLLASGRLQVEDLVTHRFRIEDADQAYGLLQHRTEPFLGIQLTYAERHGVEQPVPLRPRARGSAVGGVGVGLIGAGAFARSVLLPTFRSAGFERFVALASASGLSARGVGEEAGFEKAVSGADAVIDDPDVDVVIIATPHADHAALAARALRAGKHVFCEKPLALTMDELDDVESAWRESGRTLFVDYNRRYSEDVRLVRERLAGKRGPLVITYRVHAGAVPDGHWYGDRRQGGRLLGEVCHFVDTCAALAGADVDEIAAVGVGGQERLLSDALALSLRLGDQAVASIVYSPHSPGAGPKELIDVTGADDSATIVGFQSVVIDGKRRATSGKGFLQIVSAFKEAVATGSTEHTEAALRSTRATLQAAETLVRDAPGEAR